MPSGLRRIYGLGHLHFLTFSCYRRLPLLKTKRARDVFVRELGQARKEQEFRLVGYVVMPEHVHLLMGEPKKGTPSTVLHKLKLQVARKLRKRGRRAAGAQMLLPFGNHEAAARSFWQARFHDFNVYSHKKEIEKLRYMHANPCKRGLVAHPKEWPWSSWAFYSGATEFLIPMDVKP